MRGFGTVVTGTLAQGTLRVDDELEILPPGRRVKVRGLQVHGAAQASASAGRRVAVNLRRGGVSDRGRGDTLPAAGAFDVTRRFDAAIELLPDAKPLRHGARVRFHHGTIELLGRVALAAEHSAAEHAEYADQKTGGPEALAELRPGRRAYARVRLEGPAVLTRGDRFILRQYSPAVTIAGGRVLDPAPGPAPIPAAPGRARVARVNARDTAALSGFVAGRPGGGRAGQCPAAPARPSRAAAAPPLPSAAQTRQA